MILNKFAFTKLLKITMILLLAILSSNLIAAHIESVSPDDNIMTNQENISFDYYLSMDSPNECVLNINTQQLSKTNINDGFNSFIVTNLPEDEYDWQITCVNNTISESTSMRSLTVDRTSPVITILEPSEPDAALYLSFKVVDDKSSGSNCSISIEQNNTLIQERDVMVQNNNTIQETFSLLPGDYLTKISCFDSAGNEGFASRDASIEQEDYFHISTNKEVYALGESATLTFDTLADAAVQIDICPNQQGFVQCISPIINQGVYPQTITLPFTNKTGTYLVEAYAQSPRGMIVNNTNYSIQNTMTLNLRTSEPPKLKSNFNLIADVAGAIGDLSYEWRLTSGTVTTTSNTYAISYTNPGNYTETVVVRDSAGNMLTKDINIIIKPLYLVTLYVRDEQSNAALDQTKVMVVGDDDQYYTNSQGIVKLTLDHGTTKIYAEKTGYDYKYKDIFINENITTANITLMPEAQNLNIDVIETITNPFEVKFKLTGAIGATCTLLTNQTGKLAASSSVTVNDDSEYSLKANLVQGNYQYLLSCQQNELITSTEIFTVTIGDSEIDAIIESEVASENNVKDQPIQRFDQYKDYFEDVLDYFLSLNAEEQEVINILNIKNNVRQAKKRAGQLGRDLYDLQKNKDLEPDIKEQRFDDMVQEIDDLVVNNVKSLRIRDSKVISNYVTEDDLDTYVELYPDFEKLKQALPLILEAQQNYILSTKLYHVILTYGDDHEEEITLVHKTLSYGVEKSSEGGINEKLFEVLPTDLKDDFVIVTEGAERIGTNLIELPAFGSLVYYYENEIAFSELKDSKTVLIPDLTNVEMNAITGFSILGAGALGGIANKLGISLGLLIAIIIIAYLIYYFNLIDHIKFLIFESGKQEKVHYIRVLINDARDNLSTGNYDKALLIYKEISLSYDQLNIPEKNAVQEEVVSLCADIDKYFMNSLIIDMDRALKENRLEDAINYFEKVEGTYERLPKEEQDKVLYVVQSLAKRLGVGA